MASYLVLALLITTIFIVFQLQERHLAAKKPLYMASIKSIGSCYTEMVGNAQTRK